MYFKNLFCKGKQLEIASKQFQKIVCENRITINNYGQEEQRNFELLTRSLRELCVNFPKPYCGWWTISPIKQLIKNT